MFAWVLAVAFTLASLAFVAESPHMISQEPLISIIDGTVTIANRSSKKRRWKGNCDEAIGNGGCNQVA